MLHVTWEIDIDAATSRDAALKPLAIQRNPEATATVFAVIDDIGETVRVDLEGEGTTTVVGRAETLHGALSTRETTVAPALVESAWRVGA